MVAAPVKLTWDQALSWRMDQQLLDRPNGADTTAIVRQLAGVQAQVASSAEQAIGLPASSLVSSPPALQKLRSHAACCNIRPLLYGLDRCNATHCTCIDTVAEEGNAM